MVNVMRMLPVYLMLCVCYATELQTLLPPGASTSSTSALSSGPGGHTSGSAASDLQTLLPPELQTLLPPGASTSSTSALSSGPGAHTSGSAASDLHTFVTTGAGGGAAAGTTVFECLQNLSNADEFIKILIRGYEHKTSRLQSRDLASMAECVNLSEAPKRMHWAKFALMLISYVPNETLPKTFTDAFSAFSEACNLVYEMNLSQADRDTYLSYNPYVLRMAEGVTREQNLIQVYKKISELFKLTKRLMEDDSQIDPSNVFRKIIENSRGGDFAPRLCAIFDQMLPRRMEAVRTLSGLSYDGHCGLHLDSRSKAIICRAIYGSTTLSRLENHFCSDMTNKIGESGEFLHMTLPGMRDYKGIVARLMREYHESKSVTNSRDEASRVARALSNYYQYLREFQQELISCIKKMLPLGAIIAGTEILAPQGKSAVRWIVLRVVHNEGLSGWCDGIAHISLFKFEKNSIWEADDEEILRVSADNLWGAIKAEALKDAAVQVKQKKAKAQEPVVSFCFDSIAVAAAGDVLFSYPKFESAF